MPSKKELETDTSFAKFVQKAKKRLNKKAELTEQEVVKKPRIEVEYQYLKSKRHDEEKELTKKAQMLLSQNPNVSNPIGQLMDKDFYSKMNDEQKIRYVLKISKIYNSISKK